MEGETAVVAEHIESVAPSVLRGGGVILALVEKGPGLLAGAGVVVEADAVHREDGAGFVSEQQAGFSRCQLLKLANAGLDPLGNSGGMESAGQFREDCLADRLAVHGLSQHLYGE